MNTARYINSKGEEVDPTTMAYPHLQSALAKAQRTLEYEPSYPEDILEQHRNNASVLQAEIASRDAQSQQ